MSRVDLSGPIAESPFFAPLRSEALFCQVEIGDWGWSLIWPGDIDMGVDQLRRWADEQSGAVMPTDDFRDWRTRNHLCFIAASEVLGLEPGLVAAYDNGEEPIPRTVMLATKGFEALHRQDATA